MLTQLPRMRRDARPCPNGSGRDVLGSRKKREIKKMAHLEPRRSKCVFTAMVFGLLLALLALPNLVYGQGANATLLGTVTDVSGAVVPSASVQVTNVDTGVR